MSIQKKEKIGKGRKANLHKNNPENSEARDDIHTSIIVILIIVFTGLSGFALGKLDSKSTSSKSFEVETVPRELLSGAVIQATKISNEKDSNSTESTEKTSDPTAALVVGSKNSTKYHYPWCSGAKRIKPENMVSFASFEAARAAGYTPAGNCPGLE